jgi:hypothetical protein
MERENESENDHFHFHSSLILNFILEKWDENEIKNEPKNGRKMATVNNPNMSNK